MTGWSRRSFLAAASLVALQAAVPSGAQVLRRLDPAEEPPPHCRLFMRLVADLVIPTTETPGAGALGVGDFVLVGLAHGLALAHGYRERLCQPHDLQDAAVTGIPRARVVADGARVGPPGGPGRRALLRGHPRADTGLGRAARRVPRPPHALPAGPRKLRSSKSSVPLPAVSSATSTSYLARDRKSVV